MTIYMTSDLHVDHYLNHRVTLENYINNAFRPADVLCIAGDTCDDPALFVEFYKAVSLRYEKIFVVFGNHDLTVGNDSYFRNNPFRETEAKLIFLKKEILKIGNVTILDVLIENALRKIANTWSNFLALSIWKSLLHKLFYRMRSQTPPSFRSLFA